MPRALPIVLILVVVPVMAGTASAWDLSLALSAQSRYVWRGMVLNDSPVLQPSATFATGGMTAGVWADVNLTDDTGLQYLEDEIDYWLDYTVETPKVDVTATACTYTFPHTSLTSTTEVWVAATWKTTFEPTLTLVRDVDEVDGSYLMLSGSTPLGLLQTKGSDGLTLDLNLGWAGHSYTRAYFPTSDVSHAVDLGARLGWAVSAGPGQLSVNLQYTTFTSSDVEVPGFEDDRSNVVGGVAYSLPLSF